MAADVATRCPSTRRQRSGPAARRPRRVDEGLPRSVAGQAREAPDGTVVPATRGAARHGHGLAAGRQLAMAAQRRATGRRRRNRVGARECVTICPQAAAAREPHGTGGNILSAARSLATRRRVPATLNPTPWIQAASRKRFVSPRRQRSRPPAGPAPTAGTAPPRARAQPVISSTDTGVAAVNRSNTGQCASTTRRSSS